MELIKTYAIKERPHISDAQDAHQQLKEYFTEEKEFFICLHLNSSNQVICKEIVHVGGLKSSIVDIGCLFRNAIKLNANSIIVAHNHPSGNTKPSEEDILITNKIDKAGKILQIKLLDSIVFTADNYERILI